MEISKELLSMVYSKNILSVNFSIEGDRGQSVSKNILTIKYEDNNTISTIYENIHELAHKCKEWVLNHIVDSEIQSSGCVITSWTIHNGKGYARILVIDEKFFADTEPEAVILACEWILKEIR